MSILVFAICVFFICYKLISDKSKRKEYENTYGVENKYLKFLHDNYTNVNIEFDVKKTIKSAHINRDVKLINNIVIDQMNSIYGDDDWKCLFFNGNISLYNRERSWLQNLMLANDGLIAEMNIYEGFLTYYWVGDNGEYLSKKYYNTLENILNSKGIHIKIIDGNTNYLKLCQK